MALLGLCKEPIYTKLMALLGLCKEPSVIVLTTFAKPIRLRMLQNLIQLLKIEK